MSRLKNFNLHITDGTTNYSHNLSQFNETETISIDTGDFLYLGFKKPIHSIYFDVETVNTVSNILLVEKYNGIAFDTVDRLDETNGFKETGFIYLDDFEDEAKTTINSEEMYWIRISTTTNPSSAIVFRYINLVFCSENDLLPFNNDAKSFYPLDENDNTIESLTLCLIGARKMVLSEINKYGTKKYVTGDIEARLFNQWDLHDIDDVREPSIKAAISIQYDNSNDSGETFDKKKKENLKEFKDLMARFANNFLVKLDLDDDGVKDDVEITGTTVTPNRLGR